MTAWLATLAMAGVLAWEWNEWAQLRGELAAAQQIRAQGAKARAQVRAQVVKLKEQASSPLEAALEKMRPMLELMTDPADADRKEGVARLSCAFEYADFMEQLNFTPERRKEFINLLAKWQSRLQALRNQQMMIALGEPYSAKAGGEMKDNLEEIADAKADRDTELKVFLNNDDDYASYVKYTNEPGARQQVADLDVDMSYSDQPLNADQRVALADILSAAKKTVPLAERNDPKQLAQAQQAAVMAHAAEILTPGQIEVLQEMQAQQRQDLGIEDAPLAAGTNAGGQ